MDTKNVLLFSPVLQRYRQPRLGIAYIAAALAGSGHRVTLASIAPDDAGAAERCIRALGPSVVGATAFSSEHLFAARIFRTAKEIDRGITTVFGGPHASAMPEYLLRHVPEIDYIVRGEGEEPAKLLLSGSVEPGAIPGLCYRENGVPVVNAPAENADLDALPYPWKALNPRDHDRGDVHGYMYRSRPVAPVLSSRGCPYQCTYCAGHSVFGHRIRFRDPVKFVDELEYLNRTLGIREIQIADDNFSFHREHALSVCRQILERGLKFSWTLPNGVRADRLDEEVLAVMKMSGCYYMAFGFEFGSPRMLAEVKKSLDVDKSLATVRLASRMGFITHGFFLMGYPTETREDLAMTQEFILSLPLDRISIGMPVPYPGSELFAYYAGRSFRDLDAFDWNYYTEGRCRFLLEHLTENELKSAMNATYLKFYLNPGRLARFAAKLRTLRQAEAFVRGFGGGLSLLNKIRSQRTME